MLISLDTETTGIDLRHGAKPYLVTTCDEGDDIRYWEWDINPLTRQPRIPPSDLEEIQETVDQADYIVFQNPKFDILALRTVMPLRLPWEKVYDTLLASHLICSNARHDLSSMAAELGVNLYKYEEAIKDATKKAIRVARKNYKSWRLAKKDLPEMPSARGEVWKYDMWLPRAIAKKRGCKGPWSTVCSEYANGDSGFTLPLFLHQREVLKERGLWRIYLERLKVLPIVMSMEGYGVTLSRRRLAQLTSEYELESTKAKVVCESVASGKYGYDLKMPKGAAANDSLRGFFFGVKETKELSPGITEVTWDKSRSMNLPPVSVSKKTGVPSLDARTLEHYEATLPRNSGSLLFVKNLRAKRKRDTALTYMGGYRRFWLPLNGTNEWYRLHPSLNPTGTDTLRWSSQYPNEQNISKKEGFNLRYCFGPAPGREWWSLDAKNIELRIPAYEADETEMVYLFEHPDDPPYYGSYHLLVFDTLHPRRFAKHGAECKKVYASTWYQWTKNGNFAVQYGAMEQSGTADRAYHVDGAQRKIQSRFSKIAKLNQQMIDQANRYGYVETMPDKTVDPNKGYPLYCTVDNWGSVKPTVPLNYHVQGTAMWWMSAAMIRCHEYLEELPDHHMVMQVHDELVFDFPKGKKKNLSKIRRIQKLMEKGGEDIGLPTPVSCEYHEETWSKGVSA